MGIRIDSFSCKNCMFPCERDYPCGKYRIIDKGSCPHGRGEIGIQCVIARYKGEDLCLNCGATKIKEEVKVEPVIEKKIKFTIRK